MYLEIADSFDVNSKFEEAILFQLNNYYDILLDSGELKNDVYVFAYIITNSQTIILSKEPGNPIDVRIDPRPNQVFINAYKFS